MSGPLVSRRVLTDRLLAQLAAEPQDRPHAGDFAAVCTDLARDVWELFPVALTMTDGTVLQMREAHGGLLTFSSVAERDQAVTVPAKGFADPDAVKAICWQPFDGLAALRVACAQLREDSDDA